MTKIEIPNTSYLNSIWILFLIFRLIKQCQNTNNKSNIQTSKKKKLLIYTILIPHLPEIKLAVIIRQSKTTILPGSIVSTIQE